MSAEVKVFVDLLVRLEKLLLAEISDEEKLLASVGDGSLLGAVVKDDLMVSRVHGAALKAIAAVGVVARRDISSLSGSSAEKLAAFVQRVNEHERLLEEQYAKVSGLVSSVQSGAESSASLSHDDVKALRDLLSQAVAAFGAWRDQAHVLKDELLSYDTLKESLSKKVLRPGELDYSRFIDWVEIGVGVSGRVYKARDISSGDFVAIKKYHFTVSPSEEEESSLMTRAIERCTRVYGFDHPNLLKVIGYFVMHDTAGIMTLHLVTPFIEGSRLSDVIDRRTYTEKDIREFIHIVGQAVQYMLDRNVIHADLTPANILVNGTAENINYIMLDFENVQLKHNVSRMVGDIAYAPDEAMKEQEVDNLTDSVPFFSVGRIALHMMLGKKDFLERIYDPSSAMLEQYLARNGNVQKHFTTQLIHAVVKLTEADIAHRCHSWKDVLWHLENWKPGKLSWRERLSNAKQVLFGQNVLSSLWAALSGRARIVQTKSEIRSVPSERALPASSVTSENSSGELPDTASSIVDSSEWSVDISKINNEGVGRYDVSSLSPGARYLYPQELFGLRALAAHDEFVRSVVFQIDKSWTWTGVALQRFGDTMRIYYSPALEWRGDHYELLDSEHTSFCECDVSRLSGKVAFSRLPAQLQYLWGGFLPKEHEKDAFLWIAGSDDSHIWPVARGYGDGDGTWSLLSYINVNYNGGSRWVGFFDPKKIGSHGRLVSSGVVGYPWLEDFSEELVTKGGNLRFDQALEKAPEGSRLLYPQEYFELRLYSEQTGEFKDLVADMWSRWEWCNVAFEWVDDRFWIVWNPKLKLNNAKNGFVPIDQAAHERSRILVEGFVPKNGANAVRSLPPQLAALWGAAYDVAVENNAELYLYEGLWPVARGLGNYSNAWSLIGCYGIGDDGGSRWVGLKERDFS